MNKRIFAILSLVILAIICMGTASAFDLGSLFGGDNSSTGENITIDGTNYYIPAGFEEIKNESRNNHSEYINSIKVLTNGKTYANNKTAEVISICIATYEGLEVIDDTARDVGNEKKTIKGVDGYTYEDGNITGFVYANNGKLAIITTNNATLIDQVIVG